MDGVIGLAGSYLAMKNQNIIETVQAGLLRKSIDQHTQTISRLLEAVPAEKANPPHLGQRVDITA